MTDRELFVSTVIDLMKDIAPQFTFASATDSRINPGAIVLPFYLWDRVGRDEPQASTVHVVASEREIKLNAGFIAELARHKVDQGLRCYEANKPPGAVVIPEAEAKRIIIEMAAA